MKVKEWTFTWSISLLHEYTNENQTPKIYQKMKQCTVQPERRQHTPNLMFLNQSIPVKTSHVFEAGNSQRNMMHRAS